MSDRVIEEQGLADLGQTLKTKREVKGWTRRDIVLKTKIPMDQLEAIEDGRLSSLPPVFAKGFLRAYADELGLDAESLLNDYRRMTGGFKNEPASREPLAPRYLEISVGRGSIPGLKFISISLLLILALSATFWFSPQFRSALFSMLPSLEALPYSGKINIEEATDDNGQSSISNRNSETDVVSTVNVPIEQQASETTSFVEPAIARNGGTLTLTSQKDNVWVEVDLDNNGPEFINFKRGQSLTWTAKESIALTSGNIPALIIKWNGVDINLNVKDRRVNKFILPIL